MEILVVIAALFAAWYFIVRSLKKPSVSSTDPAAPVQQLPRNDSNQDAAAAIQKVIDACTAENKSATMLLAIVASADGRISRDEIKVIAGFCMKHGALIESAWMDSIKRLNAGVNIKVAGDKDAAKHLSALQGRPVVYLAGLYGAVIALTIGRDNLSGATRDAISSLESMLETAPVAVA